MSLLLEVSDDFEGGGKVCFLHGGEFQVATKGIAYFHAEGFES